jgi:hypothetical protein
MDLSRKNRGTAAGQSPAARVERTPSSVAFDVDVAFDVVFTSEL